MLPETRFVSGARYVCAFRGRRDSYQLPLALAEAGMLDAFIADGYLESWLRPVVPALPRRTREKLRSRYEPGLPDERISCLWGSTVVEHVRHRIGMAPFVTFAKLDRRFSLAAAERARRTRSDLLLYSPYAWEAFRERYTHSPRRVLFQFHPHPDLERRILRDDHALYPVCEYSYEREMGDDVSEALKERNRDCWRYADLILCASEFTKRSLVDAGADARICAVVPYGIGMPAAAREHAAPEAFSALFVGSGTQRKGLHHLLMAWRRAVLPANSELTLVCRHLDAGLESLVRTTPRVRLLRGVSGDQLETLFRESALFVMPSLVEGFGQVYLEALAQGCPVLGTPNTCLPDLEDAKGAVLQVEAGAIDELVSALETLAHTLPGNDDIRRQARDCAQHRPWTRFREGVRSALHAPQTSLAAATA
jgi:glycosyltransferase involved in cell wall biosynthesis